MPDRDEHTRAMIGDLVLTIATLKAENDVLLDALTNEPLRVSLVQASAARQLAGVAPPTPPKE